MLIKADMEITQLEFDVGTLDAQQIKEVGNLRRRFEENKFRLPSPPWS